MLGDRDGGAVLISCIAVYTEGYWGVITGV
jgi:hypothetical protein